MTLLLDTHAFLWWVDDSAHLSKKARSAIASVDNACVLSLASCWEIAIKVSLGRLKIAKHLDRFLSEQMSASGIQPLGLRLPHVARIAILPFHHRDPFDRLLVAQALEDDLPIVSRDAVFSRYGVARIW